MEQDIRQRIVLERLDASRARIASEYRILMHYLAEGNVLGLSRDEMAEQLCFKREDLDRLLDWQEDE